MQFPGENLEIAAKQKEAHTKQAIIQRLIWLPNRYSCSDTFSALEGPKEPCLSVQVSPL